MSRDDVDRSERRYPVTGAAMKYVQDYAEVFATRLCADQLQKCPPARDSMQVAYPRRTIHRSTSGVSAEDQAIYRKWIEGMVVFYSALLLMSAIVAVLIGAGLGSTTSSSLAARSTAAAHQTK